MCRPRDPDGCPPRTARGPCRPRRRRARRRRPAQTRSARPPRSHPVTCAAVARTAAHRADSTDLRGPHRLAHGRTDLRTAALTRADRTDLRERHGLARDRAACATARHARPRRLARTETRAEPEGSARLRAPRTLVRRAGQAPIAAGSASATGASSWSAAGSADFGVGDAAGKAIASAAPTASTMAPTTWAARRPWTNDAPEAYPPIDENTAPS